METKGKRGNRYDKVFMAQAVDLLRTSGKTRREVARDLGVSEFSLRRWEMKSQSQNGTVPSLPNLSEENRQLKQENYYLRRQSEILKKAIAIFSRDGKHPKDLA